MKLVKKVLLGAVSGAVVFNCYSVANAVRPNRKDAGIKLTVTHPGSTEKNIVVFDAFTLIDQFKRVLDLAQETLSCVQDDTVYGEEHRIVTRREINRIFGQIYKSILEPVFDFSFENYGSGVRSLKRKDFVPNFLIYTDETEHKCDYERFHDFSLAVKRKLKKNGIICRAIEEYRQSAPEFLGDAQKILDSSIERLEELCGLSQDLSEDGASDGSDYASDSSDDLAQEFVVHDEDDSSASSRSDVSSDSDSDVDDESHEEDFPLSCPSPEPESGNCLINFFRSIFSRK